MKNKDTNNTIVPALRFPEFRNTEGWEEKPLSDSLTEHKLKSDGKCDVHSVSVHKGVINQIEHLGRSFSATDTSKYNLVKPGDVIYTKSPTGAFPYGIVKQNLNDYNAIVSPLYGVFSPVNKYVGFILHSYFESPVRTNNFLSSIIRKGAKNTILISNDTFLSRGIPLPKTEAEQKKISDCLYSVDCLISAESDKLETLKAHKKALMQQLFPAEGETIPKLRFPEFKNMGGWSLLNGDDVFDSISNKDHNSDLPILAISQEHGAIPRTEIDYKVIVSDKSIESYKVVEIGDFIISLRSFQGGIEYSNYKGLCSPAYIILRKKNKDDVDGFFKYYFKTDKYIQDLNRNLEGIRDGKMVSYKQFSEILIPTPTPAEQQEIADCLSSFDDLISAQSQKLDALKDHKKGLMQQLFPNMEAGMDNL